jgi:predicted cytidylate kinase
MEKITLSGLAGSGKSTIGKLLAAKMDYQFISIGNYSREYAKEKFNLDINEFQAFCKEHPEEDLAIDKHFASKINSSKGMVVDYRLGHKFINNALHVYLDVSEDEAVKRLLNAKRTKEFKEQKVEFIRGEMNKRNNAMRKRFMDIYQTDFININNYDLIINTDKYPHFDDIANLIIAHLKNR